MNGAIWGYGGYGWIRRKDRLRTNQRNAALLPGNEFREFYLMRPGFQRVHALFDKPLDPRRVPVFGRQMAALQRIEPDSQGLKLAGGDGDCFDLRRGVREGIDIVSPLLADGQRPEKFLAPARRRFGLALFCGADPRQRRLGLVHLSVAVFDGVGRLVAEPS